MSYHRARDAFRGQTEPSAETLERVRLNARRQLRLPPPRRRAPAVIGLAAAAALILSLLPSETPITPSSPAPLVGPLLAESPVTTALTPLISADFQGEGALHGDERAPRIDWTWGTLRLSVAPEQGIDLQVQTPEATVWVIGTVFTVDTDRLGTHVTVERGEVRVACTGTDGPAAVTAGQTRHCWPVTAARLLNRATALGDEGGEAEVLLETVERGIAAGDGDPLTTAQLRFLRIQTLGHLGRYAEAAAAARAFLASDSPLHRASVREYLQTLEQSGY